jgi:proteasome lid subunit RPN8/RPN11
MLFKDQFMKIVEHAEEVFPEECLGVIVRGEYVRLENVSPEPEKSFEMKEEDELRYVFPEDDKDRCDALVHSHPDGPLYPSYADMKAQIAGNLPFVMIGHSEETGWQYWEIGDHILDEPLEEREFRHGVMDCYDDVRAWFWQESGGKILLPPFARRDKWWLADDEGHNPDNLYADHFIECGFRQLSEEETHDLRRGDCFLYKLNPATAETPAHMIETHGGVYLGDGLIFHHLPGRLSTKDNAEQWGRKASRWLRYEGEGAEFLA